MKRTIIAFLALCGVAVAASYEVAPAPGTQLALTVEKTGFYRGKKHLFLFENYRGSLAFDPHRPEGSKIELVIDSRSVVCKDDWVSSGDLKKIMETTFEDMLAVKQFPSLTFVSASIRPLGGNQFEVQGTLTIRNRPKPVTVVVQLDAGDPAQLRLRGSARISLKDYSLKPPSALLGAIGTKDEMSLAFEIAASPKD